MRRLRRLLRHFLTRPGVRRMLAGLTLATCSLLLAMPAQASGGGPNCAAIDIAQCAATEGCEVLQPLTSSGKPICGQQLHINWWTMDSHAPPLGWFIVDFLIFVGLIVHFGRKPVREAFAQRHMTVKKAIADAAEAHDRANDRYQEYDTKLANVEEEAAQFVETGRTDGALERDQIITDANTYAERLRTDSQSVVEQEYAKAQARLRREMAAKVLSLTEQTLRRELTDADRNRLIEDAIAQLDAGQQSSRSGSGSRMGRQAARRAP